LVPSQGFDHLVQRPSIQSVEIQYKFGLNSVTVE